MATSLKLQKGAPLLITLSLFIYSSISQDHMQLRWGYLDPPFLYLLGSVNSSSVCTENLATTVLIFHSCNSFQEKSEVPPCYVQRKNCHTTVHSLQLLDSVCLLFSVSLEPWKWGTCPWSLFEHWATSTVTCSQQFNQLWQVFPEPSPTVVTL